MEGRLLYSAQAAMRQFFPQRSAGSPVVLLEHVATFLARFEGGTTASEFLHTYTALS